MTEEMYNRLNDYLNDIFLELNKRDKIFIDNLKPIVILNTIIDKVFNEPITSKNKENNLTFNDVFLLGREIIEYINPEYLEEYANLSVEEILNTVGIKIDDKMINETVDIIKNSIHHYEEKTK